MKALKEIGIKKALKYSIMTLLLIIFRLMVFPQLRVIFLRMLGAKIGKNVIIHNVIFFNYYRKGFVGLRIGDNCFIGDEALIDLADAVIISNNVTLAERVTIITHTNVGFKDHPLQRYFPSFTKPVVFKSGSFLGANATVLPGVEIGKCAFVAAGSVVNKHVPDYYVVRGVPAKMLKILK